MLSKIISFFVGDLGAKIGGGVANVASIAALTPLILSFVKHKDEIAISLTWGEAGFMGAIIFAIIKAVHYARSPGS